MRYEVCVYGATVGGVAAAIAATTRGRTVIIIEPGRHVGAMTSGGLGWTDHGHKDTVGGLAGEFYRRIAAHYQAQGVSLDDQRQGPGWSHEPHVAENILRDWLAESGIRVVFEHRLAGVEMGDGRIRTLRFDHAPPDADGAPAPVAAATGALVVEAGIAIDATYEGDLLAAAGVPYAVAREGVADYGEPMAGVRHASLKDKGVDLAVDPYRVPGRPESGLLPFIETDDGATAGAAHPAVQAYNFRLCLVRDRPIAIEPWPGYDASRYELVRRFIAARAAAGIPVDPADLFHLKSGYREPSILKFSPLPRGKTDVNNSSGLSLDYVGGGSTRYAEGSWTERSRIWRDHIGYSRGLLHMLATDPAVPADLRAEVGAWGLPRDEFADTGGWPHQLYVREARRMRGSVVMRQQDCETPGPCPDAVALGSYSLDSHKCRLLAREGRVMAEGGFYQRIPGAYPIPYRALVAQAGTGRNLLVLFCVSATHAAYSSLRMEPVLMMLGHAAGLAADLALAEGVDVQAVPMAKLQELLVAQGQVIATTAAAG